MKCSGERDGSQKSQLERRSLVFYLEARREKRKLSEKRWLRREEEMLDEQQNLFAGMLP